MATSILWGEFRINSLTRGEQSNVQLQALDNGKFLTVWQNADVNELGLEVSGIYAQAFYAGAASQGDPVRINTTTEGTHSKPVVTALADGRLVYVWQHDTKIDGPERYAIRARIFNKDGTAYDADADGVGDDDFVVASGAEPLKTPQVVTLSNDSFAISYTSGPGENDYGTSVKTVVYSSNAQPYGGTQAIEFETPDDHLTGSLIALGDGRFLSIYSVFSTDAEGSPDGDPVTEGRIYTANGTSVTAGAFISLAGGGYVDKSSPISAVALSDGRFIVTWTKMHGDDNGENQQREVQAQIYSAEGEEDGDPFIVNQNLAGDQTAPKVTALSQGGFAISYLEYSNDGIPKVRVAVFDENKNRMVDDAILSAPFTEGNRTSPSIIELSDGRLIAAWNENIPGRANDPIGIMGQVIDARFKPINLPGTVDHDQLIGTELNDTLSGGAFGDDHLTGRNGNDKLYGGTGTGLGNDVLDGGLGADMMDGGIGNDIYFVDDAKDAVVEFAVGGTADEVQTKISYKLANYVEKLKALGSGAISLTGNTLSNTITGNTAANKINAGSGNDTVYGGLGNDELTGSTGKDYFVFDTALSKSKNVDMIKDFSVKDDTFRLENAIFTKLKPGKLGKAYFHVGKTASDKKDYIVYHKAKGYLYYDADGGGKGSAILFAKVKSGTDLTHADFQII